MADSLHSKALGVGKVSSTSAPTGLPLLPALELLCFAFNECTSLEGVQQCPKLTSLQGTSNMLTAILDIPLNDLRCLLLGWNR